jgi:hypothetical protein
MQSYLQYRRLGDSVRAQLDHAYAQRNANSTVKRDSTPSPSSGSASINSTDDDNQISGDNDAAARSNSEPLEKSKTQRSEKTALAHSLAGVDIQKQLASTNQPADLFIVGWDGKDDPQNPKNYSFSSRLIATLLVSALAWVVGAASSINSGVLPQNTAAFGVSDVVGSLVTGI